MTDFKNILFNAKFIFAVLFVLIFWSSCNNDQDVVDIAPIEDNNSILYNAPVVKLLQLTARNDGSWDNIVDQTSCFSISFPYELKVNNKEVIVKSILDLKLVETILDESSTDTDSILISFPITLIDAFYTKINVTSLEDLKELATKCVEFGADEDLECIDLTYPLNFFKFNKSNAVTTNLEITSDEELGYFITGLNENELITVAYPINLVTFDGETVIAETNEELENILKEAQDTCDEDDDNDFNDDDFNFESLSEYLQKCTFEIVSSTETLFTKEYQPKYMGFNDTIVTLYNEYGDTLKNGFKIETVETNNVVTIDWQDILGASYTWDVNGINEETIELSTSEEFIRLEQVCTDFEFLEKPKSYVPDQNFEQTLIELGYDDILDNYVLNENIDEVVELLIDNNKIVDLTGLEGFTALEILSVNQNFIEVIDVSKNTALKELYCAECRVETIDFANNLDIEVLRLSSPAITSLDVTGLTKLRDLNLIGAKISTLDVSKNSLLEKLNAKSLSNLNCIRVGNVATAEQNANWLKDDGTIYSLNCGKTYVPDDNFENALIGLGYDDVLDDYVLTENIDIVKQLVLDFSDLPDAAITSFEGIEAFRDLEIFRSWGSNIPTLDLSNNIKLKEILIHNAGFTTLDLSKNIALEKLHMSENPLTQLDISALVNLKDLSLYCFSLVDIDLSSNQQLEKFVLVSNVMRSIDISKNTNLIDVTLEGEALSCIKVTDVASATANPNWSKSDNAIYSLDCAMTYIPDDTFEQWLINAGYDTVLDDYVLTTTVLKVITLDLELLTDYTGLDEFINLETLDVYSENKVSIDFSTLPKLKTLSVTADELDENVDLSNNKNLTSLVLRTFEDTNFIITGLSELPELRELNIGNAAITNYDFSNNLNLEYLSITLSSDPSVDASMLNKLRVFYVYGNSATNYDFSNNLELIEIDIILNNDALVDISMLTKLRTFKASGSANPLFSGHSNLRYINLDLPNLTTLDMTGFPNLSYLFVIDSKITSVDATQNGSLTTLWLHENTLLTCVKVNDVDIAKSKPNWYLPPQASYALECN